MRMIGILALQFFMYRSVGHILTRKKRIEVIVSWHIPWNTGSEIRWLLELQSLECD